MSKKRRYRADRSAAAQERVFLGAQIPEALRSEQEIVRAMRDQLDHYRAHPMNDVEIEQGQSLIREAFGELPQRTPTAEAAAQDADSPFVLLCRTLSVKGKRGVVPQAALQNAVWGLDEEIGVSSLFHNWDETMARVQYLAGKLDADPKSVPEQATTHNARHGMIMTLAMPAAKTSAAQLVRNIESLVGVSCLGALVVPHRRHLFAIFDYHETARYAVCVLFELRDDTLFHEYDAERVAAQEESARAAIATGQPQVMERDFFTLAPVYLQDPQVDTFASQKQNEQPKLMRWPRAPAVYVTYLYFDRIEKPYANLIEYI